MPLRSLLLVGTSQTEVSSSFVAGSSVVRYLPDNFGAMLRHQNKPPAETIAEGLSDACEMHATARMLYYCGGGALLSLVVPSGLNGNEMR